ncbi:LuxR C-terminal-related transcriptional regulator [Polaribacter sargassicola]|uniref:LuxR C-terminal-related transcriptional regulator n=1 Tax=Polaribacter sargassicola TaxID=2836891 RepID=UPI0027B99E2B|nr:LuxR C-terminal-related transcriptional regulator [Polaribacter sp. DS7-9]MCG1036481.1 hypothetical protein [Polaribacter sp. DS7-9]
MKFVFFLLFIFLGITAFSQEEIYYYQDIKGTLSLNEVKKENFLLLEKEIKEGYGNNEVAYWFKVPAYKTSLKYIFKMVYDRYYFADAYIDTIKLEKIPNQRYLSYKFSRDNDFYIRVKPKFHSYIPVELNSLEDIIFEETNSLLINGFYYGFSILIIFLNFIYYFLFKDKVFCYYAFFQFTLCFGIFTMDGMLNYYNITGYLNELIMVINYVSMAYFSSKFAVSYLFIDTYFPNLKKYTKFLGFCILVFAILFLVCTNYYNLLILNILVFSLVTIYWVCGIILFNKNFYTKILVIADAIILFSAIDYFVLKFLGLSIINVDSLSIKIGAFVEMITLSFAVLYRMNVLINENKFMKNEIINYSKELAKSTNDNQSNKEQNLTELSKREKEIFDLIVLAKSNKEIASDLNISINTVKFHIKNIYEKLEIKSRKEALTFKI